MPITVVRLPVPAGHDPVERVITTVARHDLALAAALHAPSQVRPYAVARRPDALDVVCCDDALARALLGGDPAARLVTRVQPGDLIAPGSTGHCLRLAYLTPTLYRVAGLEHRLPDAVSLVTSLQERWRALDWPSLPEMSRLLRVPADAEILTYRTLPGPDRRPTRGFTGVVRYDLRPLSPASQAAVWSLVRFGEYRGAGRHTGYGFGRVRLLLPGARVALDRLGNVWEDAA